jgi:hypothetical protein
MPRFTCCYMSFFRKGSDGMFHRWHRVPFTALLYLAGTVLAEHLERIFDSVHCRETMLLARKE